MKNLFAVIVVILIVLATCPVYAVTVHYQPTPYPSLNQPGSHTWNGWFGSGQGQVLTQDGIMKIGGGSGYVYRSYLKFDLVGLPRDVDYSYLLLMTHPQTAYPTTPYAVCQLGGNWDSATTWSNQPPAGKCRGFYSAPTPKTWSATWLSYPSGVPNWYNEWMNGTVVNNGLMFYTQSSINEFDVFYSPRYNDFVQDQYADGRRPILVLSFTPTLQLKMPLPGNHKWLITTEVGGWDCKGDKHDTAHDDVANQSGVMQYNYFSIDISWRNVADIGASAYPSPDPSGNRKNNGVYIPVIAAAAGTVASASIPGKPDVFNGYYVVIDHDGDGRLDSGFQTRYIHLQPPGPLVVRDQVVQQGQKLGYLGNTGASEGPHLHFGVRYKDSGSKKSPDLAKVVMDGWILKGFQTECNNGTWNRYYRSGNVVY